MAIHLRRSIRSAALLIASVAGLSLIALPVHDVQAKATGKVSRSKASSKDASASFKSSTRGGSRQKSRTVSNTKSKWSRNTRSKAAPLVSKAAPPVVAKPVVTSTPPAASAITGQAIVTVASGGVTSTSARMASDLAAVLDSDALRVLPLMTRSSLSDAIALAGSDRIDLAFLHADAMDDPPGSLGAVATRVSYLARLFNEEIHVIASRDVRELSDLSGKKVNVGTAGSDNARTAERVFERLGIAPRYTYLDQPTALAQLAAGDLAADVLVSGRPVRALQDFAGDGRFKLLPIPYDPSLQEHYLPARIEAVDYGNLVPPGTAVDTLAVPIVLAAIDAPPGTPRAARVARFAQALFDRFDALRDPTRHPKWREVNLAASVANSTLR